MFRPRRHHHVPFLIATAFVAAVLSSSDASARPDCVTASVVPASAFDQNFWTKVTPILLPLIVFAASAAMLDRIGLERPAKATSAITKEART